MRDSYTIDGVKSEFKQSDKNVAASNESSICFETEIDITQDSDQSSTIDADQHLQSVIQDRSNKLIPLKLNECTTYSLAWAYKVLKKWKTTYDTKFELFVNRQPKEEATVVTLYPKMNCSCQL